MGNIDVVRQEAMIEPSISQKGKGSKLTSSVTVKKEQGLGCPLSVDTRVRSVKQSSSTYALLSNVTIGNSGDQMKISKSSIIDREDSQKKRKFPIGGTGEISELNNNRNAKNMCKKTSSDKNENEDDFKKGLMDRLKSVFKW